MAKMSRNILVLYLFAAAFQGWSEAMADINQVRSDALRAIDAEAMQTMNLGKETETQVNGKKNVITSISSQIKRQGQNIFTGATSQVEDEAQISFTKANMLNSKQEVFTCIFNEANSGETILNGRSKSFSDTLVAQTTNTTVTANSQIDSWYKNTTAQEQIYRKNYTDTVTQIFSATSEAAIQALVKDFEKSSAFFKTMITGILSVILQTHTTYMNNMQSQVTTLRTNTTKDIDAIFAKIKACFK